MVIGAAIAAHGENGAGCCLRHSVFVWVQYIVKLANRREGMPVGHRRR